MKPRLLVGSALGLMLIAGAAMAQSDGMGGPMSPAPFSASTPGWYGAVDIGGHFPDDFRLIPEDQATQALTLKDYQNVDVFARVGYRFNPYFRLELQGGYRPGVLKGASSFTGNETVICGAGSTEAYNPNTGALSGSCTHPYGTVDSLTFMVNGIVDLLPQYRLSPFVGAGIGVNYLSEVRVNGHAFGPGLPVSAQGSFVDIDSSPAQEAYQLLGGFTYAVTDRVNVDLTYTFL
ncbi:MAG: porin family protein, partial [Alphaproteobacteria bacterium]|nr:porin family protein [Alphaproteobacteria bacterium]